ncbi:MAG: NAD-dependent epimerase/dehydratase family protein [Anderseniella sp.]|nr:NAD-dependent epimerase/dehydratase family protein [Anderseniella sp.]
MRVLVTGTAGFIGFHLANRLRSDGHQVTGFDNMSSYYDVALKRARLEQLRLAQIPVVEADLCDKAALQDAWRKADPQVVVHLAAQAGVRYSLDNPQAYVDSNLVGFANMLELVREAKPAHFLYASTSSVYGANTTLPWSESHPVEHPVSFYAATKKSNEMMAHSYSDLFRLPMTGMRFFTVYGEWGRPDMAFFKFAEAMLKGEAIEVYNHGKMTRDFTHVSDVVDAVVGLMAVTPEPAATVEGEAARLGTSPVAPHRLVNIASGTRVELVDYIQCLENSLGLKAQINFTGMAPGDVRDTWGDVSILSELTGYIPKVGVDDGIERFAHWYRDYYGLKD